MTFSETIDALIPIYEEGMKAESYEALKGMYLDSGICWAGGKWLKCDIRDHDDWYNYSPCRFSAWWFDAAFDNRYAPIAEIIETCIRPRLELLKRIQQDLKKESI